MDEKKKMKKPFSCIGQDPPPAKQKLFSHEEIPPPEKQKLFSHVEDPPPEKQKLFSHVEDPPPEKQKLFSHVEDPPPEKKQSYSHSRKESVSGDTNSCQEYRKLNCAPKEGGEEKPTSSMRDEQNGQTESPEKKKEKPDTVVTEVKEEWKNFHLQLIEKIVRICELPDGEESRVFYRFKIITDTKEFEKMVSADDVSSLKWVQSGSQGIAYIHKGAKIMTFEEYVSRVISGSNPTSRLVYAVNGWKIINGTPVYVYSGGTIGSTLQNVSGNEKYAFEFTAEKAGTQEVFRQSIGMLDICQDKKITLPLYLFAHMGVLSTLFDEAGFPIKFVLSVIGKTNSRKTNLTLCMTKMLNRKKIMKPEVNFNGTEGGIEKSIGLHPDTVLVIDDFMPASTKAKQHILDTKLEKVLRIYGDREGIERMTDFSRNPGAGYYPVRGIGVITGEHIRGVQSSLLRTLILQIDQKSVDNAKLAYYQDEYKVFNTHLYDFIRFAAWKYNDLLRLIGQCREKYRNKNMFELPRHNEMYAQLMTGIEIILQYAIERKFINAIEYQKFYEEWSSIVQQVIQQNADELNRKDYPAILREVCLSIVENGTSPLPKEEVKDYGNQVFEDSQIVYVRLQTFLQRLRTLMELWGYDLPGLSKSAIMDILESAGLIEVRSKSEGKRTLKLPGSRLNRQTYIYIKKIALKQGKKDEE